MLKRTDLKWDNYMEYLIDAINTSKSMQRAETKPMSTPRAARESHLISRASHQRMAASAGKRIAKALNLNGEYMYASMLMHDLGHPFSAHEGENDFQVLKQFNNLRVFSS